jgi:hypothetical protein
MTLKTGSLVGWMSLRISPHFYELRMALPADPFTRCGVTYKIGSDASASDQDNEYEQAEEYPALFSVFGKRHFSFISCQL